MKPAKQTYSLAEIAERWGCSHGTVLSHVRSGSLRAIDISTRPSGRSRYIVRTEDLEEFEQRRVVSTAPVSTKRKRVKIRRSDVIEFIK